MKLKQKARTAAHRLPAVLALLLAALTTVGVVRVYALGGQALASMTVAERRAISTTVDITAQDYNANTRPDRYSVYGRSPPQTVWPCSARLWTRAGSAPPLPASLAWWGRTTRPGPDMWPPIIWTSFFLTLTTLR